MGAALASARAYLPSPYAAAARAGRLGCLPPSYICVGALALDVVRESIVLLKNEMGVLEQVPLPLPTSCGRVAVIGPKTKEAQDVSPEPLSLELPAGRLGDLLPGRGPAVGKEGVSYYVGAGRVAADHTLAVQAVDVLVKRIPLLHICERLAGSRRVRLRGRDCACDRSRTGRAMSSSAGGAGGAVGHGESLCSL